MILTLLLAATATWGQDHSPPAEGAIIRAVSFQPEPRTDALLSLLEFRVGDRFAADALRASLRNIFRLGIYADIRVSWDPVGDGIALTFQLEEIPVIEGVTITGGGPVAHQRIVSAVQLDSNNRYDQTREQRINAELVALYREEGYYAASVSIYSMVNLDTGGVRLEIAIDPGEPTRLEHLEITGYPVLPEEELRSHFRRVGLETVFREEAFRAELTRLENLYHARHFYTAVLTPSTIEYDRVENAVFVSLDINAGPVVRTRFDPPIADEEFWLAQIPFADRNVPVEEILANGRERIVEELAKGGFAEANAEVTYEIDEEANLIVEVKIDRGEILRVARLEILGIDAPLVTELRPRLNLTKKGWFSTPLYSDAALKEDLLRARQFLIEKGYLDAVVTAAEPAIDPDARAAVVTIQCQPGPLVHVASIALIGNEDFDTAELLPVLGIGIGDQATAEKLNMAVVNLREFYDALGYVNATLNARLSGNGPRRELTFDITEREPSEITKVIIAGNVLTDDQVVRGAISIQEGAPYSRSDIAESQRALYRLGIFDRVLITSVDEELQQREKRVVVQLNESRPYSLLYGFGVDSEEKFRFSFGVSNTNIYGRNIEAGFSTRVSQLQQRYQISFRSPRLMFGFLDNTLRLFYEELQRTGYGSRRKGFLFESSGFRWSDWNIVARMQYKWIDNFDRVSGIVINRFEEDVRLTILSALMTRDSRDDFIDPEEGTFTSLLTQFSPTFIGSEVGYLRLDAQHFTYRPLYPSILLATGLRIGAAFPFESGEEIPISERYFLGGSTTIRGFGLDEVGPTFLGADGRFYPSGGNAMINGNLELRFPLLAGLGGVTFYDFGAVYPLVENISLADLEHALGFGVRFGTPLGPLRLDFGKSLKTRDTQFYFTFGHAF